MNSNIRSKVGDEIKDLNRINKKQDAEKKETALKESTDENDGQL